MRKRIAIHNRINARLLAMLLLLFTLTSVAVNAVNQYNIRHLYEENFTDRVLMTNALMATVIDSEDVAFFVDLMRSQSDEFKQRQVEFYYDRQEIWRLQEEPEPDAANEAAQAAIMERLAAFHGDMAALKTDKYWAIIDELKVLKEVSSSTYLYVMADTGLKTHDGDILYSFIFDADDDRQYGALDSDGLGACDVSIDTILVVYDTKKQMEWVDYYDGDYGQLYYAYAPILSAGGEVIAVFGTDLDLGNMNESIAVSTDLFTTTFLAVFVVTIILIFTYLHRSMVLPLEGLTGTAYELAAGNIYATVPKFALKRHTEIGMLAHAIDDMRLVYEDMITSAGSVFAAANVGKLDIRSDVSKYKGDIKKLIEQINDTLDATTLYLNSVPEGIFIMSKEFEIYFRNEYFIEHFGDMTARRFASFMFAGNDGCQVGDDAYLKERINAVINQPDNNTTVWINGRCFSVLLREIDIDDKAANSILAVAIDITDLTREKENAQAAAEAKSNFLSRMSHEMRTPMNAIIGMAKIAEDTDDLSRLRYCLATIDVSSRHLLGIINDVLDMSKIEAGKFELENTPINIEKVLMRVCNIVTDNTEKKSQRFNVVLSRDLRLSYMGDELRLSQVLTNLLSNAVKFTPEHGKITLRAERAGDGDDAALRFSVADTGIGMTEEQISRLFNAFEQADGSVSRKYGGTGLGLAICKNIVEKMGGRIWAESTPGEGSTFYFEVRLERAPHQSTVVFAGIRPENIKLLIVEGDDDIRKNFTDITDGFGMVSDAAASADEAVELLAAARKTGHAYDIIFLAYDMPGANCFDILKQLNGNLDRNTVVIITTFLEWHQIESDAALNNITRYITKPLFPSSILDAINDIVGTTLKSLDIKTEPAQEATDLSGVRILLAEDVEINREIFIALLEETRVTIDIAENGLVAVAKFAENPGLFDLIIMDIQMPEMDGYQATRVIRDMDIPQAKTIPIIAMTANAFKEDIDRCFECGMNDHLAKPIDEHLVIEKIARYARRDKPAHGE